MKNQISYLTFLTAVSAVLGSEFYCPTVSTPGADRRSSNSTFRLVQWNAEWLFVDGADNCPGTTCPWSDSKAASKHLTTVASVIADLKPDLLNLCEVESCDELTLLTQDSQLSSMGYKPYMIHGTDDSTGQDVGMLTLLDPQQDLYRNEARASYPISSTTCKSSYTGTYGVSKHYITTLKLGNMNVALISMHFLAFPDDQNRCVEREAQATVIQQTVTTPFIDKGYEVILIGDINDWDNTSLDSNSNKPISQVSAILKGSGTSWQLTNVASLIKQSERYSEWYDEDADCVYDSSEVSSIDHIYLSDGLLSKVSSAYFAHSEYSQSCDNFYYSDHWPLVVDFKF